MYVSPDDARSDLLLAGAVFVFGPVLLRLLLQIVPFDRIPGVSQILPIVVPALVTVAVPVALVRYRGEAWSSLGFGSSKDGLGKGALLALPIVVASVIAAAVGGLSPRGALPATMVTQPGLFLPLLSRLVIWVGLAVLAAYVTTKARDAFRMDFSTIPEGMARISRVLAMVVGVAALIRFVPALNFPLGLPVDISSLALPLGVAATVYLVWRGVQGPSSTGFAVLLTPTVLLAVGSFILSFQPALLIDSVWTGAMIAGLGLAMGALRESRGTAWPLIGMALVIALATTMPVPLRIGF